MKYTELIIAALFFGILTACAPQPVVSTEVATATHTIVVPATDTPTPMPTATPVPPRVLTVCMGQEPTSLFPLADTTRSARGVLQAIYDGPFDQKDGQIQPVILEQIPSLANGNAELRPVQIQNGKLVVNAQGDLVSFQEGTTYRPSGCASMDCAQTYNGEGEVTMDELVVRFRILPGVLWSDGTPLTAEDSVYAFSVAQSFYGNSLNLLRFTQSYTALDELTVSWVGVPGYQGTYANHFFAPFPKHLWGTMNIDELLTSEISSRSPVGWGPYVIDEWVPGDHISLHRNDNYFRIAEGLPAFDYLVYRFIDSGDEALDALLVGECDYADPTLLSTNQLPRLVEIQAEGKLKVELQQSSAWEQAIFGIESMSEDQVDDQVDLFGINEVRQAIAMCIDRQALVDELLLGGSAVPDGYLVSEHPLNNSEIAHYEFNPEAALEQLAFYGWVDYDQDPSTPLTSLGGAGVPQGALFEFDYLIPDDAERQRAAEIVQRSLAQCGIKVNIQIQPWDQFLSPGPEGSIFGRKFDMAQFAWSESQTPACFLYLSDEIPGPYPEYAKGWGGGNLSGYSNPDFDQACKTAMMSLPDSETYLQSHHEAQAISAEDLPAIPLYWHVNIHVMRPDMCDLTSATGSISGLMHIESIEYGENCLQ